MLSVELEPGFGLNPHEEWGWGGLGSMVNGL